MFKDINWKLVFIISLSAFVVLLGVWIYKNYEDKNATETAMVNNAVSYDGMLVLSEGETGTEATTEEDKDLIEENADNIKKLSEKMNERPFLFVLIVLSGLVAIVSGILTYKEDKFRF